MDNSNNDTSLGIAARYCARLSAADCSENDRESCERWIRSDPANARAFRDVASLSFQMEHAAARDAKFQYLAARAFAAHGDRKYGPTLQRRAALAAGVLLATLTVLVSASHRADEADGTSATAQVLSAPETMARQVTLKDGSVVYIDAGSSISVDLASRERRVSVLSGRALFEVARDTSRPFIVTANNTETVALGTQFEVEKHDSETTITLVEGLVSVSEVSNNAGASNRAAAAWSERLTPGKRLSVASGSAERVRSEVETDEVISWTRGWLVFQGTRLDEAVHEINRYSNKKITLAEGSLGEMTIAGSFLAGESESIVKAIAEVLPLRVVDAGSREFILFKRYEN
jgi:transmembrane sensor